MAKLVVGSETSDRTFAAATGVLELVLSGVCQDSLVSALSEEVGALRQRVADFRRVRSAGVPDANRSGLPAVIRESGAADGRTRALVDSALSHLHRHYQAPALSLMAVGQALGCNPKYLTTCFTRIVGEHMRCYLVRLRVAHACRLLMDTDLSIKEAAYASGFGGSAALDRAFRRHVGVTPGEYRRIFAAR